jgi:hypothetical protein
MPGCGAGGEQGHHEQDGCPFQAEPEPAFVSFHAVFLLAFRNESPDGKRTNPDRALQPFCDL